MTQSIGSMSFSVGADPILLLAQQAAEIKKGAASPPPASKPPTPKFKRRTRDSEGQFKPDDPSTPQNEAWEEIGNGESASSADPVDSSNPDRENSQQ